jgi:hypothetical protein
LDVERWALSVERFPCLPFGGRCLPRGKALRDPAFGVCFR